MNPGEVSDRLALTVPCPLCGAVDYEPCVYVFPKGVQPCKIVEGVCINHSESLHRRLTKVGTPTKVPHNARKHLLHNRKVRERQLAELRRLSVWLMRYGDIFKEE